MASFDYGAVPYSGPTFMQSIESQDEDLTYLQYPYSDTLAKTEGLGLQVEGDFAMDPAQFPYFDESSLLLDSQMLPQMPLDNSQFAIPVQQLNQLQSSKFSSGVEQRKAVLHAFDQLDSQMPLDVTSTMAPTMLPLACNTTPPHVGPLDYLSPWGTPELEPTTLDEINAWMSLDSNRTSPSSVSSIATPPYQHSRSSSLDSVPQRQKQATKEKPQCWEHGCNGRTFSTYGNYMRHCRERSDKRPQRKCPRCGALFSRTTARNQHLAKNACNRIRRYSNGRQRPEFSTKTTEQ